MKRSILIELLNKNDNIKKLFRGFYFSKLLVPRQITQDIVLLFQRNLNHLIFQNLP